MIRAAASAKPDRITSTVARPSRRVVASATPSATQIQNDTASPVPPGFSANGSSRLIDPSQRIDDAGVARRHGELPEFLQRCAALRVANGEQVVERERRNHRRKREQRAAASPRDRAAPRRQARQNMRAAPAMRRAKTSGRSPRPSPISRGFSGAHRSTKRSPLPPRAPEATGPRTCPPSTTSARPRGMTSTGPDEQSRTKIAQPVVVIHRRPTKKAANTVATPNSAGIARRAISDGPRTSRTSRCSASQPRGAL